MPDTPARDPVPPDHARTVPGDTPADADREPAGGVREAGDSAMVDAGIPQSRQRGRSPAPYRLLFAASLLLPSLLFAGVAWETRQDMLRAARSEVARTTELVTEQAHSLLSTHQLVAERVSEWLRGMSWDEIARSEAVHVYLVHLRDEYPDVQAIWLADPSGLVRNASETLPEQPLLVTDRDYFQALRESNAGTFIGQMVQGRLMKRLNFNVARRRESQTGAFDGVVVVTAYQNFFVDYWRTLMPQAGVLFGLYRTDGAVLARLPPADVERTVLRPDSPIMLAAAKADRSTIRSISMLDGIERYVAFQHIPEFNVIVAHGIDLRTVAAAWHAAILEYAVFFALVAASLSALALLTMRRARQAGDAVAEWQSTAWRLGEEEAKVRALNRELGEHVAKLKAANQELETFSYTVSHELRAPLRTMHGFSEIALQDYGEKLDAEGKRLLTTVRDAATKMGQLIDDMLDFFRTNRLAMKVTEVDMAGQVRSVIAELRQGTGTRQITFEVDALPNARADAVMIRRVWANLLDNAIKFTSLRPQASITVSATRAADAIIYSVADNGIGFDMSYVGKLFIMGNRLVGAEIIGSGIGLALVKRVVTRHGGRVWAEGKPDQGATFYFTLPASGEGHDQ